MKMNNNLEYLKRMSITSSRFYEKSQPLGVESVFSEMSFFIKSTEINENNRFSVIPAAVQQEGNDKIPFELSPSMSYLELTLEEVRGMTKEYVTITRSNKNLLAKLDWKGNTFCMKVFSIPKMFFDELKIMTRLIGEPNCTQIRGYFFGNFDKKKRFCIIMDYHPIELKEYLQGSVSYSERVRICYTLAKALKKLHSLGIVYLDMKLNNVMLDEDKSCQLIDFDGSVLMDELKQNGYYQTVGTTYYVSPEVYKKQPYDYQADVFSFGIVAQEIFFGLIDKSFNYTKMYKSEKHRPKIQQSKVTKENKWAVNLINECLKEKPTERPNISEIVDILEEHFLDSLNLNDLEKEYHNKKLEKKLLSQKKN